MTEEQSKRAAEALAKMMENSPMKILRVREDQLEKTIETMKKMGMGVAAQSNAGVEAGYWRITFLPESAFNNDGSYIDKDGVERKKDGSKYFDKNKSVEDFIKDG